MNNICRFQYSFFLEGRDSPQIVIRGDSFEEFILDIEKVKTEFTTSRQKNVEMSFPQEKPVVAQPSENTDIPSDTYCAIHNVEMKERVNKKTNSVFFSHYIGVYPNGTYCSGK